MNSAKKLTDQLRIESGLSINNAIWQNMSSCIGRDGSKLDLFMECYHPGPVFTNANEIRGWITR